MGVELGPSVLTAKMQDMVPGRLATVVEQLELAQSSGKAAVTTWKAAWKQATKEAETYLDGSAIVSFALKQLLARNKRLLLLSAAAVFLLVPTSVVALRVLRKRRRRRTRSYASLTPRIPHLETFDAVVVGASDDPVAAFTLVHALCQDPAFTVALVLHQSSQTPWKTDICKNRIVAPYIRGSTDTWATRLNIPAWSSASLLPYARQAEAWADDFASLDKGYHSCAGLFRVSYASSSLVAASFTRLCFLVGLGAGPRYTFPASRPQKPPEADLSLPQHGRDYNGHAPFGAGMLQEMTIETRPESSILGPFLDPASPLYRDNLVVLLDHAVSRVSFEDAAGEDGLRRADGVFVRSCEHRDVIEEEVIETLLLSRSDVILCAGLVETPSILLRSGVGPKENLDEVDIPVVVELPGVGRNWQQSLSVPLHFQRHDLETPWMRLVRCCQKWIGWLFGISNCDDRAEAVAFYNLPFEENDTKKYSAQITLSSRTRISNPTATATASDPSSCTTDSSPDSAEDIRILTTTAIATLHAPLLLPSHIRIQSKNPFIPPLIHQPQLQNEDPATTAFLQVTTDTRRLLHDLRRQHPRVIGPEVVLDMETFPSEPPSLTRKASTESLTVPRNEQALSQIQRRAYRSGAGVGTCAMGPEGVVSAGELRVWGTRNVRVADASVVPESVS
ncbi:GMC oxidoreductase-domain-containing protein [Chytriomyces sp. MP71]|nr:GMC oxidoreductase-domain-containing protein [Chytriomyces sp. MP71]